MRIISAKTDVVGEIQWKLPETIEKTLNDLPDDAQKFFIRNITVLLTAHCALLTTFFNGLPESTDLLLGFCKEYETLWEKMFEDLQKL